MQHGYAPYLDNIQTHALAAVGVSHHGSFIFHGAECYYTPGERSRMAQCGWLAFGKHKFPVNLRFHEDICSILVTTHTHTLHRDARCEMRDAAGRYQIHYAPRPVKVMFMEWATCVSLRYDHGALHFGLTPDRICHELLSVSSTKTSIGRG